MTGRQLFWCYMNNEKKNIGRLVLFENFVAEHLAHSNIDEDQLLSSINDEIPDRLAINAELASKLASALPEFCSDDQSFVTNDESRSTVVELTSELVDKHYLQMLILYCLVYFGPELKDAIRRLTQVGVNIGSGAFEGNAQFEDARRVIQAAKPCDNIAD